MVLHSVRQPMQNSLTIAGCGMGFVFRVNAVEIEQFVVVAWIHDDSAICAVPKHQVVPPLYEGPRDRVVKAGLLFRFNYFHVPQAALLKVRPADGPGRVFALTAPDDVAVALDFLPDLLGERLSVEVAWSERAGQYVRA